MLLEEFSGIENFGKHYDALINFIKTGKNFYLENIPNLRGTDFEKSIWDLRRRFQNKTYPQFEIICVNSLFTFYWKKTIDTINFAEKFLAKGGQIYVGGIAATLVPAAMQKEIGDAVKIHIGLLDKPGDLGKTDKVIIDELPPDYSILEEIDYKYPARNAYFGYTTRGCIRRCEFCAVSTLEPLYKDYIKIQLQEVEKLFGKKQHLLLMDNNVLASTKFFQIVEDIKACGFGKGSTYTPSDEYDLTIKNLRAGFNDRAYIKKIIRLYEELEKRLPEIDAGKFYSAREENFLLHFCTAAKEKILAFDETARPLFEKYFKHTKRTHYVDFNQGLDARLIVKYEERMAKLAELNIRPLRIAFDHYQQKNIYEKAIRLAAKYGVRSMSNYILYNFHDTPAELYLRLKLNIELCEELNVAIYSFPMKYHPIKDPQYFRNRDYLGEHWNKKFIRAIQAIINATKGKIGRGRSFFEKAFGKNLDEFNDLLWMPEAMIIYRLKYENLAEEWRKSFHALNETELAEAKKIIAQNKFFDADISQAESEKVQQFLKFYQVTRND